MSDADAARAPIPPASTPGGSRPRAGWAPILRVGTRVTARYALNPNIHEGREKVADALGYVVETDEQTVTIETKRGFARIPRELIVIVKEVPPPPKRVANM